MKLSDQLGSSRPNKKPAGTNNKASNALASQTSSQIASLESTLTQVEEGLSEVVADRFEQVPHNIMRLANQKVEERMKTMPNIADEVLAGFDWKDMGAALSSNFTLPSTSSSSQPAKLAGN